MDERGLKESHGLRGIYWRLFLGVLDRRDLGLWAAQTDAARQSYAALAKKHNLHIHREGESEEDRARSGSSAAPPSQPQEELDLKVHNPLSATQSSLWSAYQADHELGQTIRHDVLRTHADVEFFTRPRVQDLLYNVLFIWGKEEADDDAGRYRQGFNELLAPVVLVLMRESQTRDGWPAAGVSGTGSSQPPPSGSVGDESLLPLLLDRDYVEHDVYALFCRIMAAMAPFFAKVETAPRAALLLAAKKRAALLASNGSGYGGAGGGGSSAALDPDTAADQTPILKKCNYIHHILLSTLDPVLYTYLNRQEVSPTLYLLRWYRLLFCREFHLEDSLLIWDVVFATATDERDAAAAAQSDATTAAAATSAASTTAVKRRGPASPPPPATAQSQQQGFVLAEYICIAMLLYVRQALLQGDNSYCLKRLLRYPPVEDVRVLLSRALHFASGWKAITSDPTLTREAWNAQEEDHLGAPRAAGVGSGFGGAAHGLREPHEDPAAFQGPWQTISSGDMGADAPLDEPLRASNSNHFSKPAHGASAGGGGGTSIGGLTASDAKNAISSSFASLKSFVKGTIAGAGNSSSSNQHSSKSHHHHQQQQQQQGGSSAPGKAKYASATLSAPNRKAPTASGISHFLAPAGSGSGGGGSNAAPSQTPSPPATTGTGASSAIVSGPSAKEHDELVLLRKAAATARKEADTALAAAHHLQQQLADARLLQSQMGALMQQSLDHIEREVAHAHGEIMLDEDDLPTADSAASGAKDEEGKAASSSDAVAGAGAAVAPESSSAEVAASASPAAVAAVAAPAPVPGPGPGVAPVVGVGRTRPLDEDVLLVGLAELKHIKDVLIGRLTLSDIIDRLQVSPMAAAPASASAPVSVAAEPSPKGSDSALDSDSNSTSAAVAGVAPASLATSAPSPTAAAAAAAVAAAAAAARAQILSDMAALHARQEAAARSGSSGPGSSGNNGGGGGGGACFPYNLAPAPAKKFAPLFEAEEAPRDKVSELFALHEGDALPGLYPAIHKPSAPAAGTANGAATGAGAGEGAEAAKIVDPLISPTAAAAAAAAANAANAPVAAAAPAPAAAPATVPSAVSSSILSGLLSSPSGGLGGLGGSGGGNASSTRSLFDTSPPSSPPFGSRGDSFLDNLLPQPRARGAAIVGGGAVSGLSGGGGAFRLEEDDSSIVLPSALAFKEKARAVPKPPKPAAAAAVAPVAVPGSGSGTKAAAGAADPLLVKPATSPVLPATQAVDLFPSASAAAAAPTPATATAAAAAAALPASSSSSSSSSSALFPFDDPLSSPAVPAARSTADVEDPLQWMGSGR